MTNNPTTVGEYVIWRDDMDDKSINTLHYRRLCINVVECTFSYLKRELEKIDEQFPVDYKLAKYVYDENKQRKIRTLRPNEEYNRYYKERIIAEFSKKLNEDNKYYRRNILGIKENSMRHSMYVLSYKNISLRKIAESEFKFRYHWSKNSKSFDKKKKPDYNFSKFRYLAEIGIALQMAKAQDRNEEMFEFHFYAEMYKIAIEFFDIAGVPVEQLVEDFNRLRKTDINIIYEIKYRYHMSEERKYKKVKKDEMPTAEEYISMQNAGHTQKEIQQAVATLYHCSVAKVRLDMKKKMVTKRKYARNQFKTEMEMIQVQVLREQRESAEQAAIVNLKNIQNLIIS